MRFFLDQNVDARVGGMLRSLGHDAWTAEASGLSREADSNLTIYAHKQSAVLVTHDREFSTTARKHIVGRHIYLACRELTAREVLGRYLPDIVAVLEHHPDVFITVAQDSFKVTFSNQTWG